jgi:hypothetical protein
MRHSKSRQKDFRVPGLFTMGPDNAAAQNNLIGWLIRTPQYPSGDQKIEFPAVKTPKIFNAESPSQH